MAEFEEKASQLVLASLLAAIASGCIAVQPQPETTYLGWDIRYDERVRVLTEPPGCRIYVEGDSSEFVGVSPTEFTLEGNKFRVVQRGVIDPITKQEHFSGGVWVPAMCCGSGVPGNCSRCGPGDPIPDPPRGQWKLKAYCEGYPPAETVIEYGKTPGFGKIFPLEPDGNQQLQSVYYGTNSILLSPSYGYAPVRDSHPVPEREAANRCAGAQREYEEALAAYQSALKQVDDTQNVKRLGAAGLGVLAPGGDKALAGLIYGGGSLANQDARRDVKVAEDRLDRAKQKLDFCNWR